MRTLRPMVQPNSCIPCRNAPIRVGVSGSSAAKVISTPMRRIRSGCCARAASGHVAAPPSSVMNARRLLIRSPRRRASRHKGISPLPVALVEGRQRAHWYPPGTTDRLVARKAKAAHQINLVVAQSKIGGRALDGFYARDFDFRQGRCRGLGCPQRPRLLRMCCKRPCRTHAYKQADEVASPHSITSSARAIRSLFRPHCHRGSDCGCNCLNRPTVIALRNDSEAIRLRVLPGRAKALRIKFPCTTVLVAGFCERLTGHLAVRRKRHSEFGAARCRGSEGLAVEESCLDVARSHRLSREGTARSDENPYDSQWSCIATFHSITSSARNRNDSGIVRPSALAVVRLITRSNLVGCSTGMSAGLAPRRILSA